METIREYLNSIFANLPATDDVLRAKQELLSMMEDKYSELREEGKSDREALDIIKEEFGNLDEIADSLGLHREDWDEGYRRTVTNEEARDYIISHTFSRSLLGFGVALCILCVVGPILSDGLADFFKITTISNLVSAISICSLFIFIAVGVGLIVLSSAREKEWRFLKEELCHVDDETVDYIKSVLDAAQVAKGLTLATGIVFCSLSVLPTVLLEILFSNKFIEDHLAPSLLFVMVAFGVYLIISSTGRTGACRLLLKLNGRESLDEELNEDEPSDDSSVKRGGGSIKYEKVTKADAVSEKAESIMDTWEKETTRTAEALKSGDAETVKTVETAATPVSETNNTFSEEKQDTPLLDTVLQHYWTIVFILFLLGGFGFGMWGRIWIIWFIAPIVHSYLKKVRRSIRRRSIR